MTILAVCFWISAVIVAYTCLIYPGLLTLLASFRRWPPRRAPFRGMVSIIVAARNEGTRIGRRIRELVGLLRDADLHGEVIVVSDGSTDDTVAEAREAAYAGPVQVIALTGNVGKAAALTAASAQANGDVLVFADARQQWAEDALPLLLENFADPQIGAVSGDLVLESASGVLIGVNLYWRFEKMLRVRESRLHSMVGVTGAISAVRRELFQPIPAGTLLDDVYWPLLVVRQGYRVVHDERARAFDRLPDRTTDEFRRKVRTLSGNWQLCQRLPGSLLPGLNPIWWQWLSHKLMRLVMPWAMVALFLSSAFLDEPFYLLAFRLQVVGYLFGLAGLWPPLAKLVRPAGSVASFLVLNAAAWLAFWVWISGRAGSSWQPIHYGETAPVEEAEPLHSTLAQPGI